MPQISTQHPRQFVLLAPGPWLRQNPVAQRVYGVVCLGCVGTLVVIWILLEQQAYRFSNTLHPLETLLFVAGSLAFVTLCGFVARWDQDSKRQYCPECLQFMRRGARVCPFCGFREEQAPTAVPAASPATPPGRRSA
jgi:hypothetical protein